MASSQNERPQEVINLTEYPELGGNNRDIVPNKSLNTQYPLIDSDPHFKRVFRYARTSDYVVGGALSFFGPACMLFWERFSPSGVSRGGFASVMRLNFATSGMAGLIMFYCRSQNRFYGFSENRREIEMDMREMTDKVKKGEPLYGVSSLSPYMQAVANRQSRYSGVFMHVVPMFNMVNHPHHGVDTAKYYQNAERELNEERLRGEGSA